MNFSKIAQSKMVIKKSGTILDWQQRLLHTTISVSPHKELTYFFINDGTAARNVQIKLSRSASLTFYGVCLGNTGEQASTIIVEHAQPQSQSFVSLKGVFNGTARALMSGTIHILERAQGSHARLEERVLLLSPLASAKTVPNLEVEANDVTASHAATVSRISEEEIFYLQTRTLTARGALSLLVRSFLTSNLHGLPDKKVRDKLELSISKKITALS